MIFFTSACAKLIYVGIIFIPAAGSDGGVVGDHIRQKLGLFTDGF